MVVTQKVNFDAAMQESLYEDVDIILPYLRTREAALELVDMSDNNIMGTVVWFNFKFNQLFSPYLVYNSFITFW